MESLKYFLERTTPFGAIARFHRERQLEKKLRQWEKNGACLPMPNLGKQRIVKQYIEEFSPDIFIETGTYKGKMVYAVIPYIEEIYSIELDQRHFQKAKKRFAGYPNIHIIQGQSGEELPKILANIHGRCLFWLDAHYSGGSTAKGDTQTPIMQELECILNHEKAAEHVILIDDARLFIDENDYPIIEELKQFILDIHPGWTIEVKDDIIRTHSNKSTVMSESTSSGKCNDTARPNSWLNDFARNVTSQFGEDGIIEKILEVINDNNKWCVEFGSWDGRKCSNTFNLINEKNYSAVLIEADSRRFKDLLKTFEGNKEIITINALVGFEEDNCLDAILKTTEIPIDFDLLSIDVDGNDYYIWEAVRIYKPKVVIIEFNPTIPDIVEFVQARDMQVTQGSSLLSITKLAKLKGYELVATTKCNAIFVNSKYFDLFGIKDNSVEEIRSNRSLITYIFSGYDGTVFIRGYGKLPWQEIAYKETRVQQLPKWARKRIGDRNIFRKKLGKIFRRLRKKNII
jgi:hypothetical protein